MRVFHLKDNLSSCQHTSMSFRWWGRRESLAPMWARLRKKIELKDPNQSIKYIWDVFKEQPTDEMFQVFTTSNVEGIRRTKTSHNAQQVLSWGYDTQGHTEQSVERLCELAKKSVSHVEQMRTPSIDDHNLQINDSLVVGELVLICTQIVLKCFYLVRRGRPHILSTVNTIARAVTKWKRACDHRMARLISYIHFLKDDRQFCYAGD